MSLGEREDPSSSQADGRTTTETKTAEADESFWMTTDDTSEEKQDGLASSPFPQNTRSW